MKPKVRAEFMPLLAEDIRNDKQVLKSFLNTVKQFKARIKKKERAYLAFQKRYAEQ